MPITRLLLLLIILTSGSRALAEPPPTIEASSLLKPYDPASNHRDAFLRSAVAYGLAKDGVTAEQALALGDEKHGPLWVPKCPICRNVEAGLRAYARTSKGKVTPPGLPPEAWTQLTSQDANIRHAAIQAMVARHVKDATQRFEMTPEHIKAMHKQLEAGRKQGMQGLNPKSFGTSSCPSCDGSLNIL